MKPHIFWTVLLLIFFNCSNAQQLIISVDGKNNLSVDTIKLMSQDHITHNTGLVIPLPVYPGKVNTYTLNVTQADLYGINQTGPEMVLFGRDDSIAISFNAKDSVYKVTGGRYPKNYSIYNRFDAIRGDYRYKKEEDNYIGYAKYIDSFSLGRQAVLDAEKAKGGMSEDVYEYMRAYIKYEHLEALLVTNSPTLCKMLPQTGSIFAAKVSASDFANDEYLGMDIYTLATSLYLQILEQQGVGKTTVNNFRLASSKELYTEIELAIDSLKGETRKEALYDVIMHNDWGDNTGDVHLFKPLFDRISKLNLGQSYLNPIMEQYAKAQLNGKPIDTAVSLNTYLVSLDNKRQSLQSVLDAYKGKKVMVDLWWTADEERVPTTDKRINSKYPSNDYTVIHIAVNRRKTPETWIKQCKSISLPGAQYYLEGNFKSSLLSYLHASRLPQYISIDQKGNIENSNVPFYFMLPNWNVNDAAVK
jgi:hypothetical protein